MSLALGEKLKIRSMIYVAAEPIPFFWPMRSFIHHNPLHGLEHLPFAEALDKGAKVFHGRSYLPRSIYQSYLKQNKIDHGKLESLVDAFIDSSSNKSGSFSDMNPKQWLMGLLTETEHTVMHPTPLINPTDVKNALTGNTTEQNSGYDTTLLIKQLQDELLGDRPIYESVDALYGTSIGEDLNELVIKSCLDFFDEGQSVWRMPKREEGFFTAWSRVARENIKLSLRGLHINEILDLDSSPEGIIDHVMRELEIPEQYWASYFTRELAHLHGWVGFIRWRANAAHYHWTSEHPGDLVEFMAVRLTLALSLLRETTKPHATYTHSTINTAIETRTMETYLQHELHSGNILPAMAHKTDMALSSKSKSAVSNVFEEYMRKKRDMLANKQAKHLQELAKNSGNTETLNQISHEDLSLLMETLTAFEKQEGMCWLQAMEEQSIQHLSENIQLAPPIQREKRPFAQTLFCIDTRSERIRRHLESVGDYQTFGIAGFFGVPVSFMELGKGSESHLCPVILTPKNLVLEVTTSGLAEDTTPLTALEKGLHDLKESVISPFVTVEAIGLLFGFDMIGKTVAPAAYENWRKRLNPDKPSTLLLADKLSREQADSVLRTVQRAVIIKALEEELDFKPESITDELVRGLRELALGNSNNPAEITGLLGISTSQQEAFVEQLRNGYRINKSFAQLQLEQLGRIGFTLDEQTNFVAQALSAIGLTNGFSRFILIAGHGSISDNNPYESALDCGACGGNHGLVSARVIAQMGNKPEVRQRLREQGIEIPEDTWFVPALHNTTTDEIKLYDLDMMPPSHLFYLDRLRNGLVSASHLCAQERMPSLQQNTPSPDALQAYRDAQRNSMDWSQVRPEWGLSKNAYFIIARRELTQQSSLDGRAFLHSYDYQVDPKCRLLENIITGPLVVGQWINMEHYFSAVDNERFGSGSKAYHNVAGLFGVMTGNLSDLRTGLPSQTVLDQGLPFHEPIRLITLIEAPIAHAQAAINAVASVKNLVRNGWIRLLVVDPETANVHLFENDEWHIRTDIDINPNSLLAEARAL